MSNHPNTIASIVAGALSIGVQWAVQRYAHQQLTGYWKNVVTAGVTAAVLFVGRDGIKAALGQLWYGPKAAWSGTASAAAAAPAAPAADTTPTA